MITQIINIFNLPIHAKCEKSWIFSLEKWVRSKMAMLQFTKYVLFLNTYEDKFLSLLMQISNFFINYEINSYSVFFYSKSIEIKIESQYGK